MPRDAPVTIAVALRRSSIATPVHSRPARPQATQPIPSRGDTHSSRSAHFRGQPPDGARERLEVGSGRSTLRRVSMFETTLFSFQLTGSVVHSAATIGS